MANGVQHGGTTGSGDWAQGAPRNLSEFVSKYGENVVKNATFW